MADNPTQSPTDPGSTQASTQPDPGPAWYAQPVTLPPGYQEWIKATGWKSAEDVFGSHRNAVERINADQLPMPKKGADGKRDLSKWDGWAELGRPEAADKYEFKDPAGVTITPELDKWFRDQAFAGNLTQAQAAHLRGSWHGWIADMNRNVAAEVEASREQATRTLKAKYGETFAAKTALLTAQMPEALKNSAFADSVLTDPNLAEWLIDLVERAGEPTDGLPGGKDGNLGLTPASAREERMRLQGDPEFRKKFMDRHHPEHQQAVDRVARLRRAELAGGAAPQAA